MEFHTVPDVVSADYPTVTKRVVSDAYMLQNHRLFTATFSRAQVVEEAGKMYDEMVAACANTHQPGMNWGIVLRRYMHDPPCTRDRSRSAHGHTVDMAIVATAPDGTCYVYKPHGYGEIIQTWACDGSVSVSAAIGSTPRLSCSYAVARLKSVLPRGTVFETQVVQHDG